MKQLEEEIKIFPSDRDCAELLMETVPLVMRTVRSEMRSRRAPDLSIPQFRALVFLYRQPGSSLSEVADYIGLTLPSISKMIDKLVTRRLIRRTACSQDRRCITLTLTPRGKSTLRLAREGTQARVAAMFAHLSGKDRHLIMRAMRMLQPIFSQGHRTEARAEG